MMKSNTRAKNPRRGRASTRTNKTAKALSAEVSESVNMSADLLPEVGQAGPIDNGPPANEAPPPPEVEHEGPNANEAPVGEPEHGAKIDEAPDALVPSQTALIAGLSAADSAAMASAGEIPAPRVFVPVAGLSATDNAALADHVAAIHEHRAAGRVAARTATVHAFEMGKHLAASKAIIKKRDGHGFWSAWLRDNFALTERTARNYMKLAQKLAGLDPEAVANSTIGLSGIYELIRSGVSDDALKDAIDNKDSTPTPPKKDEPSREKKNE
jgi:hypothetical protein